MTYAYEPKTTGAGRLNRISGPGLPAYGVEYTRLANSDAVEYVRYKDTQQGDPLAETHRMYETARDLIDYVENSAGSPSATVSKYDYASDVLGRRTRVDLTGPAFSATGNHHVQFGYNDRSELTAADRYQGNGTSPPYTHLTQDQHEFDYVYDLIGNRLTYALDGAGVSYCTNALNQPLTRRNSPCEFARETIAGQGPKRVKGQYTDIGSAITCPPSTPTLGYGLDGNLTSDGTLIYEWDAENRLIRVVPASLPAEGSKKCEFAYDYMNRRVRKQVFAWNTGAQAWNTTPESDLRFVYDQWNVVLVLDGRDGEDPGTEPDNVTVRKYTWGLDLSGLAGVVQASLPASGIHGAGGTLDTRSSRQGQVGGLLAVEETSTTNSPSYWFLYDANGNVGQVISASDQSLAARYEYDPYGNAIVATGAYANDNPFRFSTKPFDAETEHIYYGERHLGPRFGRWLNHDPIEEKGGLNVYAFVHNRPSDSVDSHGLDMYPIGVGYGYNEQTRNDAGCACKKWLQGENDNSWLDDLPDCPCTIGGVKGAPRTWYPPEPAPPTHPGATTCARSKPPTYPGSGQQCCYDGNGNLITGGGGAGTPDKVAPGGVSGNWGHFWNDLYPFWVCPLDDYLKKRPPNNGNNCPSNVR